jgi:hypothetical protein
MADLADAYHIYGQDLAVTETGDIALATKSDRTTQRIIRRLLTAPTDAKGSAYPWLPKYGVGLGKYLGEAMDTRALQGAILSQMLQEDTVLKVLPPQVTVTPTPTGATITVQYTDTSGTPKSFNFNLTP